MSNDNMAGDASIRSGAGTAPWRTGPMAEAFPSISRGAIEGLQHLINEYGLAGIRKVLDVVWAQPEDQPIENDVTAELHEVELLMHRDLLDNPNRCEANVSMRSRPDWTALVSEYETLIHRLAEQVADLEGMLDREGTRSQSIRTVNARLRRALAYLSEQHSETFSQPQQNMIEYVLNGTPGEVLATW